MKPQHVQGVYNIADVRKNAKGQMVDAHGNATTNPAQAVPLDNYAHIVGNGTANNARSNAHTLDWEGNAWFAGSLTLGDVTLTAENLKKLLELINN